MVSNSVLSTILLFWLNTERILSNTLTLLQDRSVICTSTTMDVSLTFSGPFTGGIFTEKGFTNPKCRWKGRGDSRMIISVDIHNETDCGVRSNETAGEFTVKLIISPVEGLIVDGFSAINVRCLYSTQDITLTLPPGPNGNALQILGTNSESGVVTGTGGAPVLVMQILDGHGIDGQPIARAAVGQRITLDLLLKNTAIYDFYVHSCYAHDGSNTPDASINIVDHNGCGIRLSRAIDVPVLTSEPVNKGPKHVYLHMYGFQFTSSQFVHFECQVKPCVNSCRRQQCEPEGLDNKVPLIPALRLRREEKNGNLSTLKLQAVLQIEPQQVQKAALVSSSPAEDCIALSTILPIALLVAVAAVATGCLVCILCSPRKRRPPTSDSPYSVGHVYSE